jgi:energy-coupling factor transporter ATP-binding protein EcfA2
MPSSLALKKHIYLVTGHYGSGKSNFAVNLALLAKAQGRDTVLIDLDVVNPFFRSADCKEMLTAAGIRVITPVFANTTVDVPSLPATIDTVLRKQELCVILDIGGDDAGSAALGRYASLIGESDYEMYFLMQQSRLLTQEPQEMEQVMHEIEAASRLKTTGIINNTNLGNLTTIQTILDSFSCAEALSKRTNLPLAATLVREDLAPQLEEAARNQNIISIKIYISYPY